MIELSRSSRVSDLNIGTLPGALHFRGRARTGWPDVSTLCLGGKTSLIRKFYFCVAADPQRYISMLLGCQAINKPTKF